MGQKNLAILTGWPYYRGRLKFHDLRAGMTNTPYIAFAFLEHSLINNRNVDTAYKNRKKLLKIFFHYILLFIYLLKHFKNTAIKSQKVHFTCTVV